MFTLTLTLIYTRVKSMKIALFLQLLNRMVTHKKIEIHLNDVYDDIIHANQQFDNI